MKKSCRMDLSKKFLDPLNIKLNRLINKNINNYFVGFSGGVDSTVLLDCANTIIKPISGVSLTAIHVNHNYSELSLLWKQHCIDFCKERKIKILTFDLDTSKIKGASLENQYRELRYEVFGKNLKKGEKIFLGHHLDDNIETLLFRLFRGTGLKGARSIPFKRKLGEGQVLRPFLDVSKQDIEKYAKEKDLSFIKDDSNEDISFDRNYIRNEILPLVKNRWPKYNQNINQFILNTNQSYEIVLDQIKKDFLSVSTDKKNEIVLSKLKTFPKNIQKNIIIYWIESLDLKIPNGKVLNEIVEKFLFTIKNKSPKFIWGTKEKKGSVSLNIKKDLLIATSISRSV